MSPSHRDVQERWCPQCRDERLFEQPPCADGHGFDCPEWACVDCGAALVFGVGLVAVVAEPAAARPARAA